MKKTKAGFKALSVLILGVTLLWVASQAMAASEYGTDYEVICLAPNVTKKINYTLNGLLQNDIGFFHATYIIAVSNPTKPSPMDLTITTTPTVKSPDGATVLSDVAVAVNGIVDITPTYKWGYASGGDLKQTVATIPFGVGVVFTYGFAEVNDPVYPITVKQSFAFAPTSKK